MKDTQFKSMIRSVLTEKVTLDNRIIGYCVVSLDPNNDMTKVSYYPADRTSNEPVDNVWTWDVTKAKIFATEEEARECAVKYINNRRQITKSIGNKTDDFDVNEYMQVHRNHIEDPIFKKKNHIAVRKIRMVVE